MITTQITDVTLDAELEADTGRQVWRITWTETRGGRDAGTWTHTHYTERSARRHAESLRAKQA
ncbi:hypothetical protein [Mycobacterium sp. SA01]|uniref:hypothetical protein n=1 Tax=Mycobacterium sp. SA01 TaxID=3238820 RepID=UPI00351AB937